MFLIGGCPSLHRVVKRENISFLWFVWLSLLSGGVWFALRPLSRSDGRFFFLPPRFAEYLDFHDWAVNFLALALFAFFTSLLSGSFSIRRSSFATLVLLPIATLSIEILQSAIPGRTVDLLDVIAGSFGTMFGVAGALVLRRIRYGHKAYKL
jgi:glycopeptide antibiotics resistance protein